MLDKRIQDHDKICGRGHNTPLSFLKWDYGLDLPGLIAGVIRFQAPFSGL